MRRERTPGNSPDNSEDSANSPDKPLSTDVRRPAVTVGVGVLVAAGSAGAALTLAGVRSPVTGPLTLLFLLIAPAAGTALLLRSMDAPARAVVAGAAALVADTAVAETMLVTSHWSPRGGVAAVAALSAALTVPAAARRLRGHPADGWTPAPAADGDDEDESWVFSD